MNQQYKQQRELSTTRATGICLSLRRDYIVKKIAIGLTPKQALC